MLTIPALARASRLQPVDAVSLPDGSSRLWSGLRRLCRTATGLEGTCRVKRSYRDPAGPPGDEKLATPLPAGNLTADQVGDVPPFIRTGDQIEIVPLAPGGVRSRWQVKSVELVIELLALGAM